VVKGIKAQGSRHKAQADIDRAYWLSSDIERGSDKKAHKESVKTWFGFLQTRNFTTAVRIVWIPGHDLAS
jgi:hypothetical protein